MARMYFAGREQLRAGAASRTQLVDSTGKNTPAAELARLMHQA
jgi:hypothetical protein